MERNNLPENVQLLGMEAFDLATCGFPISTWMMIVFFLPYLLPGNVLQIDDRQIDECMRSSNGDY